MISNFSAVRRPVEFVGSSLRELRSLPKPVRSVFGYAILLAQIGEKHPDAKPLSGFGGAGVLEVVEDSDGNTYRAVYTVKFEGVVYVLYAFQKKSKRGRATPKQDIERIRQRLKVAQTHYEASYQTKNMDERSEDKS